MIRSNKGMIVIKGSREYVFADFAVVVHSLKGALVESGMSSDWQLDYSYVWGKEMHTDACNLGFYVCERNCVEVIGNIFDNPELLEGERC